LNYKLEIKLMQKFFNLQNFVPVFIVIVNYKLTFVKNYLIKLFFEIILNIFSGTGFDIDKLAFNNLLQTKKSYKIQTFLEIKIETKNFRLLGVLPLK